MVDVVGELSASFGSVSRLVLHHCRVLFIVLASASSLARHHQREEREGFICGHICNKTVGYFTISFRLCSCRERNTSCDVRPRQHLTDKAVISSSDNSRFHKRARPVCLSLLLSFFFSIKEAFVIPHKSLSEPLLFFFRYSPPPLPLQVHGREIRPG